MRSKILFIVLMSFTFLACEEILEHGNAGNKDNPLVQIMDQMSDKMDHMEMTKDPDHDFVMMMIEHHKGAIEMARYELKHGNDEALMEMARMMKEMQMEEIEELEAFMANHTVSPDAEDGTAFMAASEISMEKMELQVDMQHLKNETDHDFAALMIHHHRSAVEMAEAEIEFGHVQEIIDMAQKMKKDQLKEIEDLKEWLKEHD